MVKTSKRIKLKVYYQKKMIGHLTRELNGAIEFQYSEEWIENGYAISLSLPLTRNKYKGGEAAHYFQNLLPDNKNILDAVALKFGAQSTEAVDILAQIGRDCIGAVSFYKADEEVEFKEKIKVKTLTSKEIANKIKNLSSDNPLGMEDNDFKLSLAGAQEKMALLYWQKKWCEPKEATATSHIIKKKMGQILGGIDFSESVENEHYSLELAKFFGLNTCDTDIETFEDEKVLIIKRFDRYWKDKFIYRVTQEDLNQALGKAPTEKYERNGGPSIKDMMKLIKTSNNSYDSKNLFKLFIYNDLIYNTDGHAKNISIYLTAKGYALTPFYDLLSAHFLKAQNSERYANLRSSLSVNSKYIYTEITIDDWQKEAKECGLADDEFKEIVGELREKIKALNTFELSKVENKKRCKKQRQLILDGLKLRAKNLGLL